MSLNATAATAAPTPAVGAHHHGHKKVGATDPATESASDTPGQPQTTQGLFSSLLSSLEQVVGVVNPAVGTALSAITPGSSATTASSLSTTQTLAPTQANRLNALPQTTQSSGAQALNALGGKVNATA